MIIVHGLQDKSRTGGGDASARSEPRLGDGSQLSVHGLQRRVAVRKQQQFSVIIEFVLGTHSPIIKLLNILWKHSYHSIA